MPFLSGLLGLLVVRLLVPAFQRNPVIMGMDTRVREYHHVPKMPVSRLGGVALASAFLSISLVVLICIPGNAAIKEMRWEIVASSLAMFLLGFCDDLRSLGARKKLIGQILIASVVYFAGIRIENFRNPITNTVHSLGSFGFFATIFWLVALTNLINLIDGIDGLAGGVCLMLMCLLVFLGPNANSFTLLMASGMIGSLIAFLYYNFPPAKIYMGDGGAYLLGFLIAVLSLHNSQKGTLAAALIAPLVALALPVADVSLAILRRGLKGLPLFRADRAHIHHRLLRMGLTKTRAVLVLYALSLIFLLFSFAIVWSQGRGVPFLFGCLGLVLLIAAGATPFSRYWFDVTNVLGSSFKLRKLSHYALALGECLELEAERASSVEDLWKEFTFLCRKLGFAWVEINFQSSAVTWEYSNEPVSASAITQTHELHDGQNIVLRFRASSRLTDISHFEHLGDLAAEAWHKAYRRWREGHSMKSLDSSSRHRSGLLAKQ